MSTETLDWGLSEKGNAYLSLEQLVSAHRIPIVPIDVALAHKQHLIEMSRYGIFLFFGPILYAIGAILDFFFNKTVRRALGTTIFLLVTLVTTMIGGFFGPSEPTTIVSVMQLTFWTIAAVFAIIVGHTMLRMFFFEYADASTVWERQPVRGKHGYLYLESVPDHLHDRIKRAASIPDAEVQIERFSIDPLVLVTRRTGLFVETVYIGGWATGNPLIDDV